MVYCPSAPAMPIPAMIAACSPRSGTQPGHASRPAPSAISASSQKVVAWVLSVRASTRTRIAETA